MNTFLAPVKAFISYSSEDRAYCDELIQTLEPLAKERLLDVWFDDRIGHGEQFRRQIEDALGTASIVILAVTQNFLQSEWTAREVRRAIDADPPIAVIPIIFEPCDWRDTPFRAYQALPMRGKAVSQCEPRQLALDLIADGIRQAVERVRHPGPSPKLAIFTPKDLRDLIEGISSSLAVIEKVYAIYPDGPPLNVRIDMERKIAERARYEDELERRGELR